MHPQAPDLRPSGRQKGQRTNWLPSCAALARVWRRPVACGLLVAARSCSLALQNRPSDVHLACQAADLQQGLLTEQKSRQTCHSLWSMGTHSTQTVCSFQAPLTVRSSQSACEEEALLRRPQLCTALPLQWAAFSALLVKNGENLQESKKLTLS